MTGDVAFASSPPAPAVTFRWSNCTHESAGKPKHKGTQSQLWVGGGSFALIDGVCGLTGVPGVVAVRPGQLRLAAVEQVEERPRQDDDVVDAAVQDDELAGVAQT